MRQPAESNGGGNLWRTDPPPVFQIGHTTQSEVMHALGLPSQVIALNAQTLFYYLREQQKLKSLSVIIYSHSRERIMYDRAIFFFDPNGLQQRLSPIFVGQATLEMDPPKPIKVKRRKTLR